MINILPKLEKCWIGKEIKGTVQFDMVEMKIFLVEVVDEDGIPIKDI